MDIPKNNPNIDSCYEVSSGKFRRYHGEGWRQLIDFKTQYLNFKDVFRVILGIWQSWRLLAKIRPAVVFTRGGFVSVPVAVAAKLRQIPYITHDSDSTPSLANRLIAPWADINAVAMDIQDYPYKEEKTIKVGVPIDANYYFIDAAKQAKFRSELGFDKYDWLILVTGGGNGANKLNQIVLDNSGYLLRKYPKMAIVHIAGRKLADDLKLDYDKLLPKKDRQRVVVLDFVVDLYRYSAAADIIIARGGATNLAEFSAQGRACIIIPSKQLVWNVKNAEALSAKQAIVELSEDQAEQERRLASVVEDLLEHPKKRERLINKFVQFSEPNATQDITRVIMSIANKKIIKDHE